jgi:hypothetical protein
MTSSTVLSSILSVKSSSTRKFLVRIKTSYDNSEKVIVLRIIDDTNHASEEIILKNAEPQNKNIDIFHIQTEQKLGDRIRRLKLHTKNIRNQRSEKEKNERIFLKWIELTDQNTKHTFCFPVEDYLPLSPGDALELTEVHQDSHCEENNQTEISIVNNIQSNDRLQSIRTSSETDINNENSTTLTNDRSKYAKFYDIRTKTGQQGFFGIKSLLKANVYLKFYDINHQSSESIPLTISRLHQRPFRSNQTDQFQMGTNIKLGLLKKVEIWHDGQKGMRLHCDTLEITDQTNGQIYCFQIKGEVFSIN